MNNLVVYEDCCSWAQEDTENPLIDPIDYFDTVDIELLFKIFSLF